MITLTLGPYGKTAHLGTSRENDEPLVLDVVELRQLQSTEFRVQLAAMIDAIEPVADKCERASERMRALSNRSSTPPPTLRSVGPEAKKGEASW